MSLSERRLMNETIHFLMRMDVVLTNEKFLCLI